MKRKQLQTIATFIELKNADRNFSQLTRTDKQWVGHTGCKMQSPPGSSRRLSSSKSSLVSPASTSTLVQAQEIGDELESYLSIFTGNKPRKKRTAGELDWGKLLDGHPEELLSSKEREGERDSDLSGEPGGESDEVDPDEVTTLFLKPTAVAKLCSNVDSKNSTKSAPKMKVSSDKSVTQREPPTKREFGLRANLVGSHKVMDLKDIMSLTDTSSSDEDQSEIIGTAPSSNVSASRTVDTGFAGPLIDQVHVHRQAGDTLERVDHSRQQSDTMVQKPEESRVSAEQDSSSDSSFLSEDLSTHFRNNIFTLDQLEPVFADSNWDENPDHSTVMKANIESGHPVEEGQLHNVQSLADLDSPAVEGSNTEVQQCGVVDEGARVPVVQHSVAEVESEESYSGNDSRYEESVRDHSEESSEKHSVSYEDDFENEMVVQSDADANGDDSSSSMQTQARDSGSVSREEHCEQIYYSDTTSRSHTYHPSHTSEGESVARSGHVSGGGRSGAVSEESGCLLSSSEGSQEHTSEVHAHPPLSTLLLSEYPHLHPSPHLPHLITTHTTG